MVCAPIVVIFSQSPAFADKDAKIISVSKVNLIFIFFPLFFQIIASCVAF